MDNVTVAKDDLWTIKWAIDNDDDSLALDTVLRALGVQTSNNIVEPHRTRPKADRLKVAVIVGHNAYGKGAWAADPIGMQEYDFNNIVADNLAALSDTQIVYKRFNRRYTGSYRNEIETAYREAAQWQPNLSLELHFNRSGRTPGRYTAMYTAYGAYTSQQVAGIMQRHFINALQFDDGGVRQLTKNENGGRGLYTQSFPSILTEPFFGGNPEHVQRVVQMGGTKAMAQIYDGAVREAMAILA